jgi:hypothetical protein
MSLHSVPAQQTTRLSKVRPQPVRRTDFRRRHAVRRLGIHDDSGDTVRRVVVLRGRRLHALLRAAFMRRSGSSVGVRKQTGARDAWAVLYLEPGVVHLAML